MSEEQPASIEAIADADFALIAAAFTDEGAAAEALDTLRSREADGDIEIEGVLAVNVDADGSLAIVEMTDHSTQTGAKWGVVGGIVLGIIFPPSIIAGAVAGGALGSVIGKLRNRHHRSQVEGLMAEALPPGGSGLIVLVRMEDRQSVEDSLPRATKITRAGVDAETADDIREAARLAS